MMAGRQEASHNTSTATRIGTRDDYVVLAKLADETGIAFEDLAERFEYGEEIDAIRAETQAASTLDEWLPHEEAERIVPGIYDAARKLGECPIRRRMDQKAAGMGWLWHIDDLVRLRHIRRTCKLTCRDALRAMDAMERGIL